jgi:hypothetical protein
MQHGLLHVVRVSMFMSAQHVHVHADCIHVQLSMLHGHGRNDRLAIKSLIWHRYFTAILPLFYVESGGQSGSAGHVLVR